MAKKNDKNNGTLSLVFGLLSFFFIWIPLAGLILGIFAVSFSSKQNKIKQTGEASAGKVLGIISIVANSIITVFTLMLFGFIFTAIGVLI